ncbi:MAG: DUF58 domain-containing protein [Polyangiaceae bacterium]
MRLFPTRPALDLTIAGIAVTLAGVLLFQPAVIAWGGALLVGLAVARAVTLLNVTRVRAAGFEMVWRTQGAVARVVRGETIELEAEVRNRDTRAARYVELRAIGSSGLGLELIPRAGEVPAGGRLRVSLMVRGDRVGRHGLYGLALELRGSPGLFEVPLTFANPVGVEVTPSVTRFERKRARGSSVLGAVASGRRSRRQGDAAELREIREHQFGDSFKRIAWKASARRGKLLVRDHELEERDIVWFLLDASVELWAGREGAAPLDLAIDAVASLIHEHVRQGNAVGLAIVTSQRTLWFNPERGSAHARRLTLALLDTPAALEPERSGLDEAAVATRVLEHLRALAPQRLQQVEVGDLDRIAALASSAMARAPFPERRIVAPSERESRLRSYLAAFGMSLPPRLEPERTRTDPALLEAMARVGRGRLRATTLYLASPLPDDARWALFAPVLGSLQRRRPALVWLVASERLGLILPPDAPGRAAAIAARLATEGGQRAGERELHRLGVRIEHLPSLVRHVSGSFPRDGAT